MLFYNVSAYNYHVSLFTREWIEIVSFASITAIKTVSLFTREWIEIACLQSCRLNQISLPLYEGVD